ncbi:hypothetical protein H4Q26_013637 [Puccinia striiformis f. sp. tritici PST-130]|nr:hypothetical protein H4Q26_013637 [Puccinia striiformis f. sp. tritici PST-130]
MIHHQDLLQKKMKACLKVASARQISTNESESGDMKVAIQGCCHGELDNIYQTIEIAKTQAGSKHPTS